MISSLEFFAKLRWIDGTPLVLEPYRQAIFREALDARDSQGHPRYNLVLCGRGKKNWKSADLILAALYRLLVWESRGGNQCYLFANDLGQAGDDLDLAVKLVRANRVLKAACRVKTDQIVRRDGDGFLLILPAGDVAGAHGKTYSFCAFDEVHAFKTWDLLESMQLDPHRPDALMWITSYASLYHKPGVPLYDLMQRGKAGRDPRMLFSWYGADYCTDASVQHLDPESRANPSRGSWADPQYLDQQRSRLPTHKYRRLHLNLPGLPEGSAFQVVPISDSIARGVTLRDPEYLGDRQYHAFVDMSGGSSDDAVLAIGYRDPEGQAVVSRLVNQGQPPPFDPGMAVKRFIGVLKSYQCFDVTGDSYAGETFRQAFQAGGISYRVSELPASKLYEALEAPLNAGRVVLLDHAKCEEQLLGLVWKGGKITHPASEHDDYSNALAGLVYSLIGGVTRGDMPILVGGERATAREHLERQHGHVLVPSEERSIQRWLEAVTSPTGAGTSGQPGGDRGLII